MRADTDLTGPKGAGAVLSTQPWACNLTRCEEVTQATGLYLGFERDAGGKTDCEIAHALTAKDYRTTGNLGANPFTKDSVRAILRNHFCVGDLPDGDDWVPDRHGAMIGPGLFHWAQAMRERNAHRPRRVAGIRSPWSLSGLAICAACGKPVTADGKHRARCQGRTLGNGCEQPSFYQSLIDD